MSWILILLVCGFPLGVPSLGTWEVALSACVNFPPAPMWAWKVACLCRSELRWTSSTSRAKPALCLRVPRHHRKIMLTSRGKKRGRNVKAGAGRQFKQSFEVLLSSATHHKSPFSCLNIRRGVGQPINLVRRVIAALQHQSQRNGNMRGKKEVIPLLH